MSVEYFTKIRNNVHFKFRVVDYKLEGGIVYCKKPQDKKWRCSSYNASDLLNREWFAPNLPETLENK